jgi:hypothetical protein
MSKDKNDIFAGNVAIVQSQDSNSAATSAIAAQAFFRFTGDIRETVQVRPLSTEPCSEEARLRMKKLFGAWVESGEEDQRLEELYRSRLIPSSIPDEEE